jgi:protocatechuate 3,4-dioxygenase beta subunit
MNFLIRRTIGRGLALGVCVFSLTGYAASGDCAGNNWRAVMVNADEPGIPLVLTGTVFDKDGKTPLGSVSLQIYHTDATGVYSRDAANSNPQSNSRLSCVVRTNERGQYEVRTIVPGAYPGDKVPAHVHIRVRPPGQAEQDATFSVAGDPRLTLADEERHGGGGTFSSIRPVTRDSTGVARCIRDIRIK